MKSIGGYIEIPFPDIGEFYEEAIRLNSGRNALRALVSSFPIKKVRIPSFICESVVSSLLREGVEFSYYNINENLEIGEEVFLKKDEHIIYVNFFGVKYSYSRKLIAKFGDSLILDNSQAFFFPPGEVGSYFYSPRKFFGVPDGGYLFADIGAPLNLDDDISAPYCQHLLGRMESGPEPYFQAYQEAEQRLEEAPVKGMSGLTHRVLRGIPYWEAARQRRENFNYLHQRLGPRNKLSLEPVNSEVPMVYPFRTEEPGLRQELLDRRIYMATYWREVLARDAANAEEKRIVEELLPLPIDQRYGKPEMDRILEVLG